MLHKALEGAIILETFPKTTVDVFALVLESGGSKSTVCIEIYLSLSVEELECLKFSSWKKKMERRAKN